MTEGTQWNLKLQAESHLQKMARQGRCLRSTEGVFQRCALPHEASIV